MYRGEAQSITSHPSITTLNRTSIPYGHILIPYSPFLLSLPNNSFPQLPFHTGEEIAIVANRAKCTIVTTYCGHGIGTLFHTTPNVPHYAKNKAKGTMQVSA